MAAPAPQATTAVSYTPILTDFLRLVRAPFAPKGVFEEQQEQPTFWMPWVVISIAFIVLQILQKPFQMRVRELLLQQAGRPVPAGGGGALSIAIGIVTGLITVLVIVAISAGILYLLLMLFGGQSTYKKMMTVAIFAGPIMVLQQLLTFVVLSMRGVSSINSVWDMFVSFGADLLLPADAQVGAFSRVFLAGIGPLAIWQVAITATGVMVLGKVGKGAGWSVASIAYLIGLALSAGLASFGMKMAGG
jgi:hypothetical protein